MPRLAQPTLLLPTPTRLTSSSTFATLSRKNQNLRCQPTVGTTQTLFFTRFFSHGNPIFASSTNKRRARQNKTQKLLSNHFSRRRLPSFVRGAASEHWCYFYASGGVLHQQPAKTFLDDDDDDDSIRFDSNDCGFQSHDFALDFTSFTTFCTSNASHDRCAPFARISFPVRWNILIKFARFLRLYKRNYFHPLYDFKIFSSSFSLV